MLDGGGESALVLGSYTGAFVTYNLAVWIQKSLQDFHILVVNVFYIVG